MNIDAATAARRKMEEIWKPSRMRTKQGNLMAKCYGIVHADRLEYAVFYNDWRHIIKPELEQ